MNERDFKYWLRGFMELAEPKRIGPRQLKIIEEHIRLVHSDAGCSYLLGLIEGSLRGQKLIEKINEFLNSSILKVGPLTFPDKPVVPSNTHKVTCANNQKFC